MNASRHERHSFTVMWARYRRWWRTPPNEWTQRRRVASLIYLFVLSVAVAIAINLWVVPHL